MELGTARRGGAEGTLLEVVECAAWVAMPPRAPAWPDDGRFMCMQDKHAGAKRHSGGGGLMYSRWHLHVPCMQLACQLR